MSKPITSGRIEASHGSTRSYTIGFLGSIILTITAFVLVENHTFSKWVIIWFIASLAFIQFLVQLIFFMHLGKEPKPRWKLMVFLFMVGVVGILVIGSLWIMSNLNYRMIDSPHAVNQYLNNQDGL